MNEGSSLTEQFMAAVDLIKGLPREGGTFHPSNDMMLKFYGYYKQATEGPCYVSQPSIWNVVGRAKWDAWNSLGNMSKENAMRSYVEELKKIIEAMPLDDKMDAFMDKIGQFYEVVDEKSKIVSAVSYSPSDSSVQMNGEIVSSDIAINGDMLSKLNNDEKSSEKEEFIFSGEKSNQEEHDAFAVSLTSDSESEEFCDTTDHISTNSQPTTEDSSTTLVNSGHVSDNNLNFGSLSSVLNKFSEISTQADFSSNSSNPSILRKPAKSRLELTEMPFSESDQIDLNHFSHSLLDSEGYQPTINFQKISDPLTATAEFDDLSQKSHLDTKYSPKVTTPTLFKKHSTVNDDIEDYSKSIYCNSNFIASNNSEISASSSNSCPPSSMNELDTRQFNSHSTICVGDSYRNYNLPITSRAPSSLSASEINQRICVALNKIQNDILLILSRLDRIEGLSLLSRTLDSINNSVEQHSVQRPNDNSSQQSSGTSASTVVAMANTGFLSPNNSTRLHSQDDRQRLKYLNDQLNGLRVSDAEVTDQTTSHSSKNKASVRQQEEASMFGQWFTWIRSHFFPSAIPFRTILLFLVWPLILHWLIKFIIFLRRRRRLMSLQR